MQIIISASDAQQQEMAVPDQLNGDTAVVWVHESRAFLLHPAADAFVDVLFDGQFFSPQNKPLLIAATENTLQQLQAPNDMLARFCGWPGFLQRPLWELAATPHADNWLTPLMTALGKKFTMVKDVPGLVAPKVIASIINEACYALDEEVADDKSIDLAMTLGTNYPYGPIDWLKKIGPASVQNLLTQLSIDEPMYSPHPLLKSTVLWH